MNSVNELERALRTIPLETCAGPWVHVTPYRWRKKLLSAEGAKQSSGRFHRAGEAPAIYVAESPVTALLETGALLSIGKNDYVVNKRRPQVLISVTFVIPQRVLDLTRPSICELLGTRPQELTGSWLIDDDSATQLLGQTAYASGRIVAIKYPSARWRDDVQANMVVFRDRLAANAGCSMSAHDPHNDLSKSVEAVFGPAT